MYLRFARRRKDGKEHRYWSIVESRRCAGGRVVQRPILYLGEMNDGQREAWCHQIEAFDEASGRHRQAAVRSIIRAKPEVMNGDPRSQQSASARVSDRHPELAHGFHDGWDIGVGVAQEFLGLAAESEQFGTSEIGGV